MDVTWKSAVHAAVAAWLVAASAQGVADVVEIVDALRAQGCGTVPGVAEPFHVEAPLDAAARAVAEGRTLERAISGSGYRARRSASIHVRSSAGDTGVTRALAQRYCATIADARLVDLGLYRRGEDLWLVLAEPFVVPDPTDARVLTDRVVALINQARSEARRCGRERFLPASALRRVPALDRAALSHAQDMASRAHLGHEGSDGSTAADRVSRQQYLWVAVAENVAGGQTAAADVVATWIASPGHCANLMGSDYSDTGVAFAVNPDDAKGIYWVQVFAAPQ